MKLLAIEMEIWKIAMLAIILVSVHQTILFGQKAVSLSDSIGPGVFPFDQPCPVSYTPAGKHKIQGISLFALDKKGCIIPPQCCNCNMTLQGGFWQYFRNKFKSPDDWESKIEIEKAQKKLMDLEKNWQTERIKYKKTDKWRQYKKSYATDRNLAKRELKNAKKPRPPAISIEISGYTQKDSGAVNFTLPPLRPNNRYILLFSAYKRPEEIDKILAAVKKNKNDSSVFTQMRNSTENQYVAFTSKDDCTDCDASFTVGTFRRFINYYKAGLGTADDEYQQKKAELEAIKNNAKTLNGSFSLPTWAFSAKDNTIRKELLSYFIVCVKCKVDLWQLEWLKGKKEELSAAITRLDQVKVDTSLVYGFGDFTSSLSVPPKSRQTIGLRLSNLAKSIEQLSALLILCDYVSQMNTPPMSVSDYSNFRSKLLGAIDLFKKNYKILSDYNDQLTNAQSKLKKASDALDKTLAGWEGFHVPFSNTVSSSFTYNFDTRSGFSIKPDFGFMYYGNRHKYADLWGVAPFLGFHVNFRPYNTNVPFKMVPCKGLLGRFSFHSGVLIGSFTQSGVREGLIGSTAVFTGLGYAFGHAVRLTAGGVWYRADNPDPLVTTKTVAVTPYVGLALDLRLKDIYTSFKKLFEP